MKKHLFWIVLIGLLLVGLSSSPDSRAAPLAVKTVVLQQGLNGYTRVADTWISSLDWDNPPQYNVNYGQNEILRLSRDGSENPVLRFDVSGIPSNSQVISATLSLYNATDGECNTYSVTPRYTALYGVLQAWDEGNQVGSPIDSAGDHGATGDYAVQYYTGQGTNVSWNERGMQAGSDYAAGAEATVGVRTSGWYAWDVTRLARAWVHGDLQNYGMVLRDLSGYAESNCDWRDFASSQGATAAQRPKLTVIYNPDTPYANAGPDQANTEWNGGAITLDGSASEDRPGGNDATLTYRWRIFQAGYGSTLAVEIGSAETLSFTPDVAGEWEIELTVTNDIGESASDRVHLRLLKIAAEHPRIFLTPQKLAMLKARAGDDNPRWQAVLRDANDGNMGSQALVSQITGDANPCQSAIDGALAAMGGGGASGPGDIALVFDWCHAQLTPGEITTFVTYLNNWATEQVGQPGSGADIPGLGNYWPRFGYSFALVGLATYGDNPDAQKWMDEYRIRRFDGYDKPWLDKIAAGGGWPEGTVYDWIANLWRMEAIAAWHTATGESLYEATPWFQERLKYVLLHRLPGTVLADWSDVSYHPYLSTGDAERNRGSMANYERIMALILIEHFSAQPLAQQLQAYLGTPPADQSLDFVAYREFLWFNPAQPAIPPTPLSHYAGGIGSVFVRSGWPTGAADTASGATYLTFQCGDHFTYHQHYDQNSFTIFKYGDLALDSGVYSGDGLSWHDINYYVRTIAHNTLVIYNPDEEFYDARPDAESNDGGQRTMRPGGRAPVTVAEFERENVQYETGSILHFDDTSDYTYILGDATAAYNNPAYNQAMNSDMVSNTAKVSNFLREFVYLRPETAPNGASLNDYVILYDRVGVTEARFSGQNTKLMFHIMNEPAISGGVSAQVSPGETLYTNPSLATTVNGNGKLFIRPLLPQQRNLRVVGGRGQNAFWVFGENYDWHWDPSESPLPITDFDPVPYGEWRIELEPADTALHHNFLTVLQPTISTTVAMPAMSTIDTGKLEGVLIADPDLNRVALFSAAANGQAPTGTLEYFYHPITTTLNLVFDLTPGASYALTATLDGDGVQAITLTPGNSGEHIYTVNSQGVLRFVVDPSGELVAWPEIYLPLIQRQAIRRVK